MRAMFWIWTTIITGGLAVMIVLPLLEVRRPSATTVCLFFGLLFLAALVGQSFAGYIAHNARAAGGGPAG